MCRLRYSGTGQMRFPPEFGIKPNYVKHDSMNHTALYVSFIFLIFMIVLVSVRTRKFHRMNDVYDACYNMKKKSGVLFLNESKLHWCTCIINREAIFFNLPKPFTFLSFEMRIPQHKIIAVPLCRYTLWILQNLPWPLVSDSCSTEETSGL